jgi:hypothetical protein
MHVSRQCFQYRGISPRAGISISVEKSWIQALTCFNFLWTLLISPHRLNVLNTYYRVVDMVAVTGIPRYTRLLSVTRVQSYRLRSPYQLRYSTTAACSRGPLCGIRILDLTRILAVWHSNSYKPLILTFRRAPFALRYSLTMGPRF